MTIDQVSAGSATVTLYRDDLAFLAAAARAHFETTGYKGGDSLATALAATAFSVFVQANCVVRPDVTLHDWRVWQAKLLGDEPPEVGVGA